MFPKADDVTAAVAIHLGITPLRLEQADRAKLVELSREHAFSIRDLRGLALRWGIPIRRTEDV